MREWLRAHAHSTAAFVAMLCVAALLAGTMGVAATDGPLLSALPGPGLDLPGPEDDQDGDSYADSVDLVDGDAHVRISVEELDAGDILPYLVIGTQDDHWRTGAGRELEWRHAVDPDPLGHKPGSRAWTQAALRTGAWWYSLPMEHGDKAMAPTGTIGRQGLPGIEWPQTFHIDVREDMPTVSIHLQLMDARPNPDRVVATWDVEVDVPDGTWHAGSAVAPANGAMSLASPGATLTVRVDVHPGIAQDVQARIAQRWAPELRFDSEERFFPTSGQTMQQFHGFSRRAPADGDLRTWTFDFDNGRDNYVLFAADFNGDRRVDHIDVELLTSVLRAGGAAPDQVYASVRPATGDRVVVQYWFVYMYNFVEDETGAGVAALAHRGDREFIQLTFASVEAALAGHPSSIAFSQHYHGVVIEHPAREGILWSNGTHPIVYPARGSHASYPAPGDDRRFRPALSGYGDRFDGLGERWTADDYGLELLGSQEWAFGHLWGPFTRYSRDLGTASKPLLQHSFRYPYIDAMAWQETLRIVEEDDLERLYGAPP